jgi:hypothetical protein
MLTFYLRSCTPIGAGHRQLVLIILFPDISLNVSVHFVALFAAALPSWKGTLVADQKVGSNIKKYGLNSELYSLHSNSPVTSVYLSLLRFSALTCGNFQAVHIKNHL